MKILVTGADGFAASRILSYYRTRHEMLGKNHRQMDVTDSESVRREFDAFRPQVVFHAGAVSDTGACAKDPGVAWLPASMMGQPMTQPAGFLSMWAGLIYCSQTGRPSAVSQETCG